MAVTDGKCLARLKGCAGISARAEDAPGGPRKPQEAPGSFRRPQEVARSPTGSPRRLQEAPGGPRKPQEASGGPRKPQEVPGGFRKPKEVSGSPRESQEAPGGSTRPWGGSRMFQETLGSSRGPQALDESASECAPRLSGSATFRKHARGAEARATFCPVARDVHRVPIPATHFAKPTTRKSTLRRSMPILYWFLTGRMAPPAWGCLRRPRGMCAASHSWHAFRIVDDKTGHVERKNVDLVLVF